MGSWLKKLILFGWLSAAVDWLKKTADVRKKPRRGRARI